MTDEPKFPAELLSKPNRERVRWFKEVVLIPHRELIDALEALRVATLEPPEGAIINLFGPAGTGKTTILRKAQQAIIKAELPNLDPGRIPFLLVRALGPDRGTFNWPDFYKRGLIALKEVLIEHKIRIDENGKARPAKSLDDLRLIYEETLARRGVKYVAIDEAQNLATVSKGRRLFDQTECIKSLGIEGGSLYILAGPYRLLDLRSLSAQVGRRTVSIHLSNYKGDNSRDIKEFKKAVKTFQNRMPYPEPPDLESRWEYLYLYSCGCVGVLKDWLTKAYSLSLSQPGGTLAPKHLEKTALSKAELNRMSLEIWEGQKRLEAEDGPQTLEDVKRRLGMKPAAPAPDTGGEPPKPNQGRQRIGEPKPQRFPVPGEAHEHGVQ